MAISDAQYSAWLTGDNKSRVVLVEAQAWSGGSLVTRYFSDRGFVSAPTDTPANIGYEDIVLKVPSIRSQMSDVFKGKSTVSFGEIIIDNSNGVRDSWLADAWDGRQIKMFLGDVSWNKADYRLIFFGVADDIQAYGNNKLTLSIRDRQQLLKIPIQQNRVGGAGSTKDQKIPVCYGEVKNVEPVLIDSATRKYQVHDGSIQALDAVYQDGVLLGGGNYTATLGSGFFVMNVAVTGRITCDVKGSNAGSYVNKTADIFSRIITDRSSLVSGDIDNASITQLNTDAPGIVGIYVSDDAATVLSVLDELVGGAGGYYCIGRDGKARVGLFKAPSGTPVLTIYDDDIKLASLELVKRITPMKSIRVGYAKFYVTISSGAAAGLNEATRQRLSDEYLVSYAATGATNFLLAVDGDIEGTCYVSVGDANTESARRAVLWGSIRRVFKCQVTTAAQQVNIGDVIQLSFNRYSLSSSLAVIVAITESATSGFVDLEVFL